MARRRGNTTAFWDGVLVTPSAAATLTTSLTGSNNDLDYTAQTEGSDGNDITIAYVDLGIPDTILDIDVDGTAITITLELDSGTNEIQSLTASGPPDGGTFTLSFDGVGPTSAIDYDASAAVVQAALEGLANIEVGDVVCGGGDLPTTPVTVTFEGNYAAIDVPLLVVDDGLLENGTLAAAEDTPGVVPAIETNSGEIITLIEATPAAAALVAVVNSGSDNGTGAVTILAATNLSGGTDDLLSSNAVIVGHDIDQVTLFVTTSAAVTVSVQVAFDPDQSGGVFPDFNVATATWANLTYLGSDVEFVFLGAGSQYMIVPDFTPANVRLRASTTATLTAGWEASD